MGVVCTSENKTKKRSIRIMGNPETNNNKNELEKQNNYKFNYENTYNSADNLKKNLNKNKPKNLSLEHYIFYIETIDKNEYFITSNFDTLKYYSTYKKFYSKWEEILQFTRPQKKFSYRNLNQNHNFVITTTEKKYSSLKIVNNYQEYIKNNNNNNKKNNISNIDEASLFNYLENTGDKNFIGRGSQIINYNCRNSEYSDLILKFQIAFFFNKYRFIKYLSKGPPNNIRWTIWVSFALCQSGYDFITEEKYLELINKNDKNFETYEEEQIKKDLNRSNQNREFIENKNSLNSLYNILKALAIEDPELGYCQGMNILAANFLMISDGNEFETFNMLRFFFKRLELREFFLNGFPKLIMYIFILKEFIKDNLPKLYIKILELDIPEESWIFKWLQTLYNLTLPLSITIRLIDCILCFGLEFLINFSLAFIKIFEKKLLFCEDINEFLRTFKAEEIINPNILINSMLSRTNSNFEDFNECNKRFENNKDTKVAADDYANVNKIFADNKIKNNNEKIINTINNKNFSCNNNLNELENESTTNSPNRKPMINKAKKQEISCFNLSMKSSKECDKNHNSNYNYNNNKDVNLNSDGNSKKFQNNNNLNNIDDRISEVGFTADSSIKYMINTKEELLAFREKLITKAKKIDLKDAIRKMIDNYTQQNLDVKNKFNDNESSTGDGINEEKSHVYEHVNNLFNNNGNITGVTSQVPFEISYKSNEKETIQPIDLNNTYYKQEFNLSKGKRDSHIKSNNISKNENISNSMYSIRKNSFNSQNSKNSVKEHLLNEVIMEEKDINYNEQCDLYISNNSNYSINYTENYSSQQKNRDSVNKYKFCNKCLLRLNQKKLQNNIENKNKFNYNNKFKLYDKTSEEVNCLYCKNHLLNSNDHSKSNNILNNEVKSMNVDKAQLQQDEFLNVDLYLQGTNLEHSFNSHNKRINHYPTENKIGYSQRKKISFAEIRVSNTNNSPQRSSSLKKNHYSCKNNSYNNNSIYINNHGINSEKTQFPNKNFIPPCVKANKAYDSQSSNDNINFSQNKNLPFKYKNNNNTKNDLHRFNYELNQANQYNCKNNSPVFTKEQISLMHNIKDKLDIIKNFDYLDIEENENENEEDYNNELFNVDENFDFDNEWENRSKINRNINEAGISLKNISGIWSPEKLNNIKHKYYSSDLNICNNNDKYNIFNKSMGINEYNLNKYHNNELEKEINFEEKNVDCNELNSLYEHSYCVYDEINQKVSNIGMKKESDYLNSLSRNDSNKQINSLKNNLIYNSNESENVFKENNKDNFNYDLISEIPRGNANEFNSEYLKRNCKNKNILSNDFSENDSSIRYKNNQSSYPFINHQIKTAHNLFVNDVVNCSLNPKNKKADLNVNNKIQKKDINTDFDQEDLKEKNNTLNVKVNGSNKSIIKINLANSLSSNKTSNQTSKGFSNLNKNFLRKSNKNLTQVQIDRYSNNQLKGNKTNYINYQNKKDNSNSVLNALDDERINTIHDEYSTFDRTVQNTKNIKGFDTKILIRKKN